MVRTSRTPRPQSSNQRNQVWTRLQSSPRHGELLQPASQSSRSIFFTSCLLRANGEPC